MSKQQLTLIRGIPGSGKSTFATKIQDAEMAAIFEADNYFIRPCGYYDFNPRLLPNAHKYCYDMTNELLNGEVNIIVANTFTRIWEMQKYINLAKEVGAELVVYRCVGRYKNIHGVPEHKVQEMLSRFEDYEGEIIVNGEKND